jgi:hypothetical protein
MPQANFIKIESEPMFGAYLHLGRQRNNQVAIGGRPRVRRQDYRPDNGHATPVANLADLTADQHDTEPDQRRRQPFLDKVPT